MLTLIDMGEDTCSGTVYMPTLISCSAVMCWIGCGIGGWNCDTIVDGGCTAAGGAPPKAGGGRSIKETTCL